MSKLLELQEKRANIWEQAKAFLDEKQAAGDTLSTEDAATYDKMEADVMALGKEIDRLKTQAAIDLELSRPASTAIVNKPAKQDVTKHGRFSDAYAPAFWDSMRGKSRPEIRNTLKEGADPQGGYLGEITSDYYLDPTVDNNTDGYPHQRTVKWLSDTSRKNLSKPLRSSLKVHRTTANLSHHSTEIDTLCHGKIFTDMSLPRTIDVSYPLRPNFNIDFKIPTNMSSDEAQRLSAYFSSLYFQK